MYLDGITAFPMILCMRKRNMEENLLQKNVIKTECYPDCYLSVVCTGPPKQLLNGSVQLFVGQSSPKVRLGAETSELESLSSDIKDNVSVSVR